MPKKIILISCSSKKGDKSAKAKELYKSQMFKSSLAYAYRHNPDKIFILSALHCLVELEEVISPYDVTLSIIPKPKRYDGLTILTQSEKTVWGVKVIEQLSKQADITTDTFIVLAGIEYIKPIKENIINLITPLKGKRQGERVKFLNEN